MPGTLKKCPGNVTVIDSLIRSETHSWLVFYPKFQPRLLRLRDAINANNNNNGASVWRALACKVYFPKSISTNPVSLGSDSWKG